MSFPPPWPDYGMHKTQAIMNGEDSGIGSCSESGSTTSRISSARGSNDSALGSMSSHRNSTMSFPPPWSGYNMHKTPGQAMMNREDSGIGSCSESGSTAGRTSSARGRNDSALGSMSSHRNSTKSFPHRWSDLKMYETRAMRKDRDDSGIGSSESGSRISSARGSIDSALGSMSDRRSSTSSNISSISGLSALSLSSRTSGQSSNGYPDSVSSSRRSSLSSVRSDDSKTTLRSDMTATSAKSNRTSVSSTTYQQKGFRHVSQSSTGTSPSCYTRVGSPYSSYHAYGQSGQTRTTNTQPPSALIQILVRDFNGRTHMVNLRRTDKVSDLRVKIEEKLKSTRSIAPCQTLQFYMSFQGKCLDDKLKLGLESLGMQNLSTVFLRGRFLAGALCK